MKFTIDRSKWRCGQDGPTACGIGDTLLRNQAGFMCCLGHICVQQKVSKASLLDAAFPDDIQTKAAEQKLAGTLLDDEGNDSDLTSDAVKINDDETMTRAEREAALKELFRKHGHTLTFVGRAVVYKSPAVRDWDCEAELV